MEIHKGGTFFDAFKDLVLQNSTRSSPRRPPPTSNAVGHASPTPVKVKVEPEENHPPPPVPVIVKPPPTTQLGDPIVTNVDPSPVDQEQSNVVVVVVAPLPEEKKKRKIDDSSKPKNSAKRQRAHQQSKNGVNEKEKEKEKKKRKKKEIIEPPPPPPNITISESNVAVASPPIATPIVDDDDDDDDDDAHHNQHRRRRRRNNRKVIEGVQLKYNGVTPESKVRQAILDISAALGTPKIHISSNVPKLVAKTIDHVLVNIVKVANILANNSKRMMIKEEDMRFAYALSMQPNAQFWGKNSFSMPPSLAEQSSVKIEIDDDDAATATVAIVE